MAFFKFFSSRQISRRVGPLSLGMKWISQSEAYRVSRLPKNLHRAYAPTWLFSWFLENTLDSFIQLQVHKLRLANALRNGRSTRWCLTLWSRYIRARDGDRCVCCDSTDQLQAHHIWRRATYPHGWFELGNGVKLCRACHRIPHAIFNRAPDLSLPFGAENGDQDEIAYLYGALYDDAKKRGIDQDEFYFISDRMLSFFVKVQGYEELFELVGYGQVSRIRMAHEIWRWMPECFYAALGQSLGVDLLPGQFWSS